jgi:SAM-dependent methyltransferase
VNKSRFHNYEHALEFDSRSMSDIRMELADRLIEAMALEGGERLLDVATGTGRFARPVAEHLPAGTITGVDESLTMFRVSKESKAEAIPRYQRIAGTAESVPLADDIFDKAWVAFSLHHFTSAAAMIRETRRVLKPGGRLFILDPVVLGAEDGLDAALSALINDVFQRSHGANFRFFTADEIARLMRDGGLEVLAVDTHSYAVNQDGTDGIPTGRHWIEVIDALEAKPEELRARFQERYFEYEKRGDKVYIEGRFHYALVVGEKQS